MKYNFDSYLDRNNTNSFKWDGINMMFGTKNILPMWIADMDLPAPEPVVNALKKRAEHPAYGYAWRSEEYHKSILNWLKNRHQWEVDENWLTFSPGIVPAISIAILTLTEPNDKILIQSPVYAPFFLSIQNNGRKIVVNQLKCENNYYTMDFEDLENKLATGVKLAILCSPHNPVGRVWKKDELEKFGRLCKKYNTFILSDEIHSDVVFNGHKHTPLSKMPEFIDISITCVAPSKTFNIAGLCTSVIIIPDKNILQQFDSALMSLGLFAGNVFGVEGLIAAYTHGEEWLEQVLVYIEDNYNYARDYINKNIPLIKPIISEGTYLLWLDCTELKMNGQELEKFMIEEANIGLDEGVKFGPGGEGFMRMNIGCPRSLVKEGLERIEKAVNKIK